MHTWCGHWQAGNGTSPITDAGPASSGRWQPPCWLLVNPSLLYAYSHISVCYFSYFLWHLWIFKPDVLFPSFSRLEVEVFLRVAILFSLGTVECTVLFTAVTDTGCSSASCLAAFEFRFSINREMLTISTGVLWIDCYVWRGQCFLQPFFLCYHESLCIYDRVLDRILVSPLQTVIAQEGDSVTSSSSDVCAFPKWLGSLILKF